MCDRIILIFKDGSTDSFILSQDADILEAITYHCDDHGYWLDDLLTFKIEPLPEEVTS